MVHHPIAFALFATIVGARAQGAMTLPPPLRVEGAAIAKVDAATTNINWEEATVGPAAPRAAAGAAATADQPRLGRHRRVAKRPGCGVQRITTSLPVLEEVTVPVLFTSHPNACASWPVVRGWRR